MNRLYSLSLFWNPTPQALAILEASLGTEDWLRFSAYQYFLWTRTPLVELERKLLPVVMSPGQFVLTVIHPEAARGAAAPWIWDWLNDRMDRQFRGVP